ACGATVLAVNRSGRAVDGADVTLAADRTDEALAQSDHVVLAAPDTPETRHVIDDRALALLQSHSWVVNVARGPLIDQAALYRALTSGAIGGAALDVTDPEPPADDDPLFDLDNVVLTPHVANPAGRLTEEMAPFLTENLRRYAAGEELLSVVESGKGYRSREEVVPRSGGALRVTYTPEEAARSREPRAQGSLDGGSVGE